VTWRDDGLWPRIRWRLERLGIEDQLARCVRAEEDMAARQAREVDVRQRDRVAGARLGTRRPARHVGELADQLVLALLRLRERVAVELASADPPAPGVVARRDPGLHLEDEDPVVRVDDDEIRFAVPRGPAVAQRARAPQPQPEAAPWGSETRIRSRRGAVLLVDQPAEQVRRRTSRGLTRAGLPVSARGGARPTAR
jgi:hypothetical protein